METMKNHDFECSVFHRKVFKKTVIFFLLLAGLSACNPFQSRLDGLGKHHDYNDLNIPLNFYSVDNETPRAQRISNELFQKSLRKPAAITFKVDAGEFQLAHDRALRWNGCFIDQEAMGGPNNDSFCGMAFLHKSFHENLNLVFSSCVREAATAAGYSKPVKVFIHHLGTYSNRRIRNGRRLSLHARARAMDIVRFNLFNENGKRRTISTYKRHYQGSQAVFYDEFRDCWKSSLPHNCAFSQRGEYLGSIGHPASRLGGDPLHNDHLHLSFPLCATEV